MVNLKFPDTDVVSCVFSLKNSSTTPPGVDEFGIVDSTEVFRKLKQYKYRVPEYLKGQLQSGDFVVVYCSTGYQVCQVARINETCTVPSSELASVVCKVDLAPYLQDLQHQADLARMHAELLKQREQLEKQIAWDLLASKSPEFAALLQNYRDAGGQL